MMTIVRPQDVPTGIETAGATTAGLAVPLEETNGEFNTRQRAFTSHGVKPLEGEYSKYLFVPHDCYYKRQIIRRGGFFSGSAISAGNDPTQSRRFLSDVTLLHTTYHLGGDRQCQVNERGV